MNLTFSIYRSKKRTRNTDSTS